MAKYTDDLLAEALGNYWAIREDGELPEEMVKVAQQHGERAPFESAVLLLADLDGAIDALCPNRWLPLAQQTVLDDFYTDITHSHKSSLIYNFSFYQQAIMRYHWLRERDELNNAAKARKFMRRFLNEGVPPPVPPTPAEMGRLGGLARARRLTKAERKQIATKAANDRWGMLAGKHE